MVAQDSRLELPASPRAAGLAREFIRNRWSHLEATEVLDAVMLCVSELVTNALDHGLPPYELWVASGGGSLRIEVVDASERVPVARRALPWAHRGRGMFLVDSIATRWGVDRTADGKRVWAEFVTA